MIGIIGAMAIEVEGLIAQMTHAEKRTLSGRDFYSGQLCGKDVVVVQSGIGKVNAAMCAEALILAYHPELVVNTGVAGAFRWATSPWRGIWCSTTWTRPPWAIPSAWFPP